MKRYFSILIFLVFVGCASPVKKLHEPHDALKVQNYVDQGVILMRVGRLDDAEASFRVALGIANLAQAYDGLGCVAFLRGDIEEAQRWYLLAIKVNPEYAPVYSNLGLLAEMQGDLGGARKLYARALEHDPEMFRARNNLGALLASGGSRQEARLLFREALVTAAHPLVISNIERLQESEDY